MSHKWSTKVWGMGLRAGTDQSVMLALADLANDTGEAYPSIEQLMERTGRGRRAVIYALARLERDGLIIRQRRNGQRTHYWIQETSAPTCTGAKVARVQPDAHTSAPTCTPPVQLSAHRTVIDPSLTRHSDAREAEMEQVQTEANNLLPPRFPELAKSHLSRLVPDLSADDIREWEDAWYLTCESRTRVAPGLSIIEYLVDCPKRKIRPSPDGFTRWFSRAERFAREDEVKASQAGTVEAEQPKPWWER